MMKKLGVIMMMMCVSVGVMGQKKHSPTNYVSGLSNSSASYKFASGLSTVSSGSASDVRGDFSMDFTKGVSTALSLKVAPKNENWSFVVTDKLGTTNDYTPFLSNDRWAVDNELGVTVNRHFGTSRWSFTDTLNAIMLREKISRDVAYDTLEARGHLSQFRTMWIALGAKWAFQDQLMLKDSLFVGMDNAFNSNPNHSAVLSISFNGLHVLSYRHGIQISGSIGYGFKPNATNYELLTKVDVSEGRMATDTASNFIISSKPTSKGRTGILTPATLHHVFSGDIHFVWRPSSKLAMDVFAIPQLTLIDGTELLDIQLGVNLGIVKDDKSKVNLGIVLKVKNATVPFEDEADRQARLIPSFMVGVPIPEIKKRKV